jgi:hypothetical protein
MDFNLGLNLFEIKNLNFSDLGLFLYLLNYSFELKKKQELNIYTPFFRNTDVLIVIDNEKNRDYLHIFQFFYKLKANVNIYSINEQDLSKNEHFDPILTNSYYKYIILFLLNDSLLFKIKSFDHNIYNNIYFNLDKNFFAIFFILSIIFSFYEMIKDDTKKIKIEIDDELISESKLGFLYHLVDKEKIKSIINNLFFNKEEISFIVNISYGTLATFEINLLKLKDNQSYKNNQRIGDILSNLILLMESFFVNYLRYII